MAGITLLQLKNVLIRNTFFLRLIKMMEPPPNLRNFWYLGLIEMCVFSCAVKIDSLSKLSALTLQLGSFA